MKFLMYLMSALILVIPAIGKGAELTESILPEPEIIATTNFDDYSTAYINVRLVVGDKTVGYAECAAPARVHAELMKIYVNKPYRGNKQKKYGAMLLQTVEKEIFQKTDCVRQLYVAVQSFGKHPIPNEKAQEFYARNGFEVSDPARGIMVKNLKVGPSCADYEMEDDGEWADEENDADTTPETDATLELHENHPPQDSRYILDNMMNVLA